MGVLTKGKVPKQPQNMTPLKLFNNEFLSIALNSFTEHFGFDRAFFTVTFLRGNDDIKNQRGYIIYESIQVSKIQSLVLVN
jgi:hypothetical protein